MARKVKPLIYIFCEGESEIAYSNFLKETFSDVAVIKKPVKGLFETAQKKFKKDAKYKNNAEITDEIWFFFDVDDGQTGTWDSVKKITSNLEKLKKNPRIRIRLLMTTGCVEYWFLLHYKKIRPSIQNVAEKDNVEKMLRECCPGYEKGDVKTTEIIAQKMEDAIKNGKWVLAQIDELPTLEDNDIRNRWLYNSTITFTTVQDAIEYLKSL